ncbi:HTR2C [Bugula neritina]|uniref:HTR2C n=1 Tax=Bugula neritina TaxID=10212 RepID=A0A7J7ITK0_BUGNE|nr:HTR2C [Bugula neritina]
MESSISNTSVTVHNTTKINVGEDNLTEYTRYWYVLLLIISLLGVTGNLLVIIAVRTVRRLNTATNMALSSLAIADLLVSALVVPLRATQHIMGHWPMDEKVCLLFMFLDVCLSTASIWQICIIAFNRCVGIYFPIKNSAKVKTAKTNKIEIGAMWLISVVIAIPVLVKGINNREFTFIEDRCTLNDPEFQIYGSMVAFFVPLAVMIVIYGLTQRQLKRKRNSIESGLRRTSGVPSANFEIFSVTNKPKSSRINHKNSRIKIKTTPLVKMHMYKVSKPTTGNIKHDNCDQRMQKRKEVTGHRVPQQPSPLHSQPESQANLVHKPSSNNEAQRTLTKPSQTLTKTLRHMGSPRSENTTSYKVDKQRKASYMLSVVFMAFVISWTPFFIMNTIDAICTLQCWPCFQTAHVAIDIGEWLGYVSSIINPIIYTIINKDFQTAFKNILLCQCYKNARPSHPPVYKQHREQKA